MTQDRAAEIASHFYHPRDDILTKEIRTALATAHEEGRREGLEEAAQEAEALKIEGVMAGGPEYYCGLDEGRDEVVKAIRALAAKDKRAASA